MQGDRETAFQSVSRAEQSLDGIIEIDAAGLQLCAHGIVDAVGRAVLDLMPQFHQEGQVVAGAAFDGALGVFQAVSQFPVFFGALRGLVVRVVRIPVIDPLAPELGVEKIGPGDDRGDDEQLGTEGQARAVERVDRGDHRLSGFDQQFVALERQAGLQVHIRPGREK